MTPNPESNLDTPPPSSSTREALELRKLEVEIAALGVKNQYECEKLKAEIENLKSPYYRTYQFYAALLPMVLAVAGIIYSWSSGWFDTQQKKLDTQRIALEFDIKQLEVKKAQQQALLDSLATDRNALRDTNAALSAQLSLLTRQKDELQGVRSNLEAQLKGLAGTQSTNNTLLPQLLDLQRQVRDLTATNAVLLAHVRAWNQPPPTGLHIIAPPP